MDTVTFREAPEPTQPTELPQVEVDNNRPVSGESDREPIEIREEGGGSVVLDALAIEEKLFSLPEEAKADVAAVKDYVLEAMKSKGLAPTVGAFKKVLDGVKEEMGLDPEAEPSIVLDRIAGVARAWKNLAFISDPAEKKRVFFRLASMKTSGEMNKEVYRLMEERKVWR